MRAIILSSLAVIASAVLAGCENIETNQGLGFAREDMLVTSSWLAKNLDNPSVVVVQVGTTPAAYTAGHVPGAQFVAIDELAASRDGLASEMPPMADLMKLLDRIGADRTSRIVLYDDQQGVMAARAYVTFDYVGLGRHTSLLDGQLAKWQRDSNPTVKGAPATQPATRPVAPDTGPIVAYAPIASQQVLAAVNTVRDMVWLHGNVKASQAVLIDARDAQEYTGKTPGEGVARPGHITGAVNIPWRSNLQDGDVPVFRSRDELRNMYVSAGAVRGSTIVTYCRTGTQACMDYFVLKYLGFDVHLYDGSYQQWSSLADAQIATGEKP